MALCAAACPAVFAGAGDVKGAAAWRQITAAVDDLQPESGPHEAVIELRMPVTATRPPRHLHHDYPFGLIEE